MAVRHLPGKRDVDASTSTFPYGPPRVTRLAAPNEGRHEMSLIDKATGRVKKAVGDLTDDPSVRREGQKEERKGEAKEDLANAQDKADEKADEVADLERRT
jgi:uncharacterized protein YjbJ (UPF0337 family)